MTAPKPPSRTADQFVLRLPDGMRDLIAKEAKANDRSMNAEIVARLKQSLVSHSSFAQIPLLEQATPASDTENALPFVKISHEDWKSLMDQLKELGPEVRALPLKIRMVPEGTVVNRDKTALIKHLGADPKPASPAKRRIKTDRNKP